MTQEYLKGKKEILLSKGWTEVLPEFKLDHFLANDFGDNVRHVGYYFASLSNAISKNPFAIFSEEMYDAQIKFLKTISPNISIPEPPVSVASINSTWPFNSQYMDNSEAAFEELTYRVIVKIVKALGTPNEIYQSISFTSGTDELIFTFDPQLYDLKTLPILGRVVLVWDDVYASVQLKNAWSDNGLMPAHEWTLFADNIRQLTNEVISEIGVELNPKTYQLGIVDPEFKVDSFPEYIIEHTSDLYNKMGFLDKEYPERFNVIIEGPPGYGKTRWTQAFASEILAPRDYLIILVDYSSLQDLIIPEYIDKVALIVNDADTLALDRDESEQGETEQILAWLDGSRSSFIKPFYLDKRTSIITILTANSVDKWDKAALRKGRIHAHYKFDQINLSEWHGDNS